MGIVIFTKNDTPFMVGDYVLMVGQIDTPPSGEDTTYILRTHRFTEADVKLWLPYIGNRLVVCIDKAPKITEATEDHVIIDDSLKIKSDRTFLNSITSMLNWNDRRRVWFQIRTLPIPLALAFLRKNRGDISLWRRIARNNMVLNDSYIRGILAYGVEGDRKKTIWPKKRKQEKTAPLPFRQNDAHWEEIVGNVKGVANEVRAVSDDLPKGMRKSRQPVNEWL